MTYVPGEEWAGSISATHSIENEDSSVPVIQSDISQGEKQVEKAPEQQVEESSPEISTQPVQEDDAEDDEDDYEMETTSKEKNQDASSSHDHDDYDYRDDPQETEDAGELEGDDYAYEDSSMPSDNFEIEKASPAKSDEDNCDKETLEGLQYLKTCKDLECIAKAHKKLNGKTKFNAPHFFLIGFQKCATTSVNHYLRGHPEYLPSVLKEAHYFTACRKSWDDTNCKANSTQDYIDNYLRMRDAAEHGLKAATVDASVDYAWKGEDLAKEIYAAFPWLKIVVMMREPISRVISYTRMWTQKGVRVSTHKDNRIACDDGEDLFDCLYPHLTPEAYTGHYAVPLEGWLKVWPADQIHVIQFEEFVDNTDAVMRRLKKFLGMDPTLPKDVQMYKNVNTRKDSGGSPMKRRQYRTLIEMARPDSEKVAQLLHKYGLADKKQWMGRWEAVWDGVLNSCNASRICLVNSN